MNDELIKNNIGLIYHIANKFLPCPDGYCYEMDDLISEGYIALVIAAKNYNPAKASFSTYACKVIESKIKSSLKKYNFNALSLDIPIDEEEEEETVIDTIEDNNNSVENIVIRNDIIKKLQLYISKLLPDEKEEILNYINGNKINNPRLFNKAKDKILYLIKKDRLEIDIDDLTIYVSCPAIHNVSGHAINYSSPVERTILYRERLREQQLKLITIPNLNKLRILKAQGITDDNLIKETENQIKRYIKRIKNIKYMSRNIPMLEDYFVNCLSNIAMINKYGSNYPTKIQKTMNKIKAYEDYVFGINK